MHVAAFAGHAEILSLLLEHGGDLEGLDEADTTPLHFASWKGKLEAAQCPRPLDHGANINAREIDGWTPLLYTGQ